MDSDDITLNEGQVNIFAILFINLIFFYFKVLGNYDFTIMKRLGEGEFNYKFIYEIKILKIQLAVALYTRSGESTTSNWR